jgi:hypothetical protein
MPPSKDANAYYRDWYSKNKPEGVKERREREERAYQQYIKKLEGVLAALVNEKVIKELHESFEKDFETKNKTGQSCS